MSTFIAVPPLAGRSRVECVTLAVSQNTLMVGQLLQAENTEMVSALLSVLADLMAATARGPEFRAAFIDGVSADLRARFEQSCAGIDQRARERGSMQ